MVGDIADLTVEHGRNLLSQRGHCGCLTLRLTRPMVGGNARRHRGSTNLLAKHMHYSVRGRSAEGVDEGVIASEGVLM